VEQVLNTKRRTDEDTCDACHHPVRAHHPNQRYGAACLIRCGSCRRYILAADWGTHHAAVPHPGEAR